MITRRKLTCETW